VLRSPLLPAAQAQVNEHIESGMRGMVAKRGAVLAYREVDLTGVNRLEVSASARDSQAGGTVQVRVDSAQGDLLAESREELSSRATISISSGVGARSSAPRSDALAGAGRPASGRGGAPASGIPVDLRPIAGKHDLYLVFVNDAAKEEATLLSIASVRLACDVKPRD